MQSRSRLGPKPPSQGKPRPAGRLGRLMPIRSIMSRALGRLRGRHLFVLDTLGILFAAYLAVAFRNLDTIGTVSRSG